MTPHGAPEEAAARVAAVVDRLCDVCDEVGAAYRALWSAAAPSPSSPSSPPSSPSSPSTRPVRADLAPLRSVVLAAMASHPEIAGCGAVVAPGLLADRERWLEWWERGPDATSPLRLLLDLDPSGEDFYDYPAMPWFAVPRDERRRAVSGPYVDFRGANRYVYTVATPVVLDGTFLGVGGVDVAVERVEPLLLRALDGLDGDALVVTADRRVVVATTGRWTPGSRLRSLPAVGEGFDAVVPVTADLGWVLAVAPGTLDNH